MFFYLECDDNVGRSFLHLSHDFRHVERLRKFFHDVVNDRLDFVFASGHRTYSKLFKSSNQISSLNVFVLID